MTPIITQEIQEARERGYDFGHGSEVTADIYEVNRKLLTKALISSMNLDGEDDESLSLIDLKSNCKSSFREAVIKSKPGQPGDSEAVWKALSLDDFARDTRRGKNKDKFDDICEVLFTTTLYHLLRSILSAISGETTSLDDKVEDNDDDDSENYNLFQDWPALTSVQIKLWEILKLELAILDIELNPELHDSAITRKTGSIERRKMIMSFCKKHDISDKQGYAFSGDMITLVLNNMKEYELFTIEQQLPYKKELKSPPYRLIPTDLLLDRIQNLYQQKHVVQQFAPTLIPPLEWNSANGGIESGGYYVYSLPFYKFKGRNDCLDLFERCCVDMDYSGVFTPINALQNTPWRINKRVWSTVQDLILLSQIPPDPENLSLSERPPLIQKIAEILVDLPNIDKRKKDKKSFKKPGNRLLNSDTGKPQGLITASLIEDLLDKDRFYFVYQVDTRGRIYNKAGWLNPQGEDLARSFLEFADSKPLTANGVTALAIHASQLVSNERIFTDLGITNEDVPTFEQRESWVRLNSDNILNSAREPLQNIWWLEVAKKPFQFLAFCFAWKDYLDFGESALCALPIHQDGTCNGLQHFAALTRDSSLAKSTNLFPEKPQDIYLEVASSVKEFVSSYSTQDNPLKLSELSLDFIIKHKDDLFTRDIAKKIVMVIPYGAKDNKKTISPLLRDKSKSIREKIYIYLGLPLRDGSLGSKKFIKLSPDQKIVFSDFIKILSNDLDKLFLDKVKEKYDVIDDVKKWLRSTVRPLLDRNIPVLWCTPSGFCAIQRNFDVKKTEISRSLFGDKIRLSYLEITNQIDVNGQRRGILPNLIHSYDSAHLIKTIQLAVDSDITHFSVVHDSFATHPSDSFTLAKCIRQGFVDIYKTEPPVLKRFETWCHLVVDAYDNKRVPPTPEYFTDNEIKLLQLVAEWGNSNIFNKNEEVSKKGKSSSDIPVTTVFRDKFDISVVLDSRYFFG